jgi:hypothetical protein
MSILLTSVQHRRHRRLWARVPLVGVHGFVAIGAAYGTIMLITDGWRLDRGMLQHLPIDTWVVPGIALAVLVAVPHLIAGVLVAIGHHLARGVSLLAGAVLVAWIIGQIALIRQYFVLQPVMAACGLLTIGLAYLLPTRRESS